MKVFLDNLRFKQVLKEIKKFLKEKLSKERYIHTIGVTRTSAKLAKRYNEDIKKAIIAALLHDSGKTMKKEFYLDFCKEKCIKIKKIEKKNPSLLHSKISRFLTENIFNILDNDVLNAIENHTIGRKKMSLLEKIVFISDFNEPKREFSHLTSHIYNLAFEDIDKAILETLRSKIIHSLKEDRFISLKSVRVFNHFLKLEREKQERI